MAQASGGRIKNQYSSYWKTDKYVDFKNGSISQTYGGKYKIKVEACFGEALKIVSSLREMNQTILIVFEMSRFHDLKIISNQS